MGVALIFGNSMVIRIAVAATVLIMLWYASSKLSSDKNLIGNLNGFKREFALSAAGAVLAIFGGGEKMNARDMWQRRLGCGSPALPSTA